MAMPSMLGEEVKGADGVDRRGRRVWLLLIEFVIRLGDKVLR